VATPHHDQCDDLNPCTVDTCVSGTGCVNDATAANGFPCGDPADTSCDNPDTCLGGMCQVNHEPDGTTCDDLSPCTTGDECTGGVCSGDTSTVVSPNNMHGWVFFEDNAGGPGSGNFVVGPPTPPLRTGSAHFLLNGNAGPAPPADRQNLATLAYAGTRFDQITNLEYSTYRSSVDAGNNLAISLQFDVDYDLTDGINNFQGRVVFEPYQGINGNVPQNTWQTWHPLTSGAWWATRAPGNGPCGQATPCTWAQFLLLFPNSGVHTDTGNGLGLTHFRAGSPWPNFEGNVDAFTIGVAGSDTTWDFEPTDPCDDTSACTTDTCDPITGCVHTQIVCDDNDPCTTDTCNPQTGCVYTPVVCNDGNACTDDVCDPNTGMCVSTNDNTNSCTDNNGCTLDVCIDGVCTSTPTVICNDNNQCTDDTCDPMTGMCVYTPDDTNTCSDGNACTAPDVCRGGVCSCDNHGPCPLATTNSYPNTTSVPIPTGPAVIRTVASAGRRSTLNAVR
jgi:hypothetical protein